jgi:hypothetical protein
MLLEDLEDPVHAYPQAVSAVGIATPEIPCRCAHHVEAFGVEIYGKGDTASVAGRPRRSLSHWMDGL